MTTIEILIPHKTTLSMADLAEKLRIMRCNGRFTPFDNAVTKLTENFSQHLLDDKDARRLPELQALGFWLRPAAIETMKKEFVIRQGTIAVPQGLVFHIPPANVDTMFAYSLFISLLCGNANVVRLPSRRGHGMQLLVRLLGEVLALASETLRISLLILGYDHDPEITKTISQASDLRVIWGGDATVNAVRAIPLAPSGRELVFPDRFSWSAIKTKAYSALDETARQRLAERYFNDLLWFDQRGCASPRIILWCGKYDREICSEFYRRVAAIAETKKWRLDAGNSILKQTLNFGAMIDMPVTQKRDFGMLTIFSLADLSSLPPIRSTPYFGGTLFEFHANEISDIAPHIERRDQTLTQFGFDSNEIETFVRKVNGRGFDRVTLFGEALAFSNVWDGYDLLANFTRLVAVSV